MTQRERLMERSGCRCENCGNLPDWRGLHVHHKKPKGMGGTKRLYADSDLEVLCARCHSVRHHLKEGM